MTRPYDLMAHGPRRWWTREEIHTLIALVVGPDAIPIRHAARRLGISPTTARRFCSFYGIPFRRFRVRERELSAAGGVQAPDPAANHQTAGADDG